MKTIMELLCFFVLNCYRNHQAKFEIYRTILTYLNYLKELTDTEKTTDPNHRKALLLKT